MRIVFNTTFIVNEETEQEWIGFIREHYIGYLHTRHLTDDILFTKVSIDQSEGRTYSLQLVFRSPEVMDHFIRFHLPGIEEKMTANYKNHYLCFSSTLTEI